MKDKKSLEERFCDFAKSIINGTECIDDLRMTQEQKRAKKADFFFNHRKIVCEVKSLKKDMEDKVNNILLPYNKKPEWPVFYGKWELSKVLNYFPDKEKINKEIFDAVTSSIETLVRDANRQIRTTKSTFGTLNAEGLLVLLNDMVHILSPEVIVSKVIELLKKRTPGGEIRFQEILVIWMLNETHFTQLTPSLKGNPSLILLTNHTQVSTSTESFMDLIQSKWASYNCLPLITMKVDSLKNFQFQRVNDKIQTEESKIKRSDLWRLEYRQNPYLRLYNKKELLNIGREIFKRLEPIFLKGSLQISQNQRAKLWEKWTHFLEEMNIRGIDMREFTTGLS